MAISSPDAIEAEMEELRSKLKKRGAQGIRGLARNFKICDRDGSRSLDVAEFGKCCGMCKLGLSPEQVRVLHGHFDRGGDGLINFDEFLRAIRGRLSPTRRKLVIKVFNALDAAGDQNGFLTIEDLQRAYSADEHPEVKAGRRTEQEVLLDLLEVFEGAPAPGTGSNNSKKGDGMVTLDEWIAYYEEVSSSVDSDDYFGVMLTRCWCALKTRTADGRLVPAISYVPAYEINTVEKLLRKSIAGKVKKNASEARTVEDAFKQFDLDRSGRVSFAEFRKAMERFGLSAAGETPGAGGVPAEVLQALFDRYDTDASGELTYCQFARGLFDDDAKARQASAGGGMNPLLPSISSPERPATARGEPLQATRPNSAFTRGRSMANPAGPRDPDYFKKSSGIFRPE